MCWNKSSLWQRYWLGFVESVAKNGPFRGMSHFYSLSFYGAHFIVIVNLPMRITLAKPGCRFSQLWTMAYFLFAYLISDFSKSLTLCKIQLQSTNFYPFQSVQRGCFMTFNLMNTDCYLTFSRLWCGFPFYLYSCVFVRLKGIFDRKLTFNFHSSWASRKTSHHDTAWIF